MTPTTSTLSYRGTPIRLRGAMLNLTDMWRAAGCPEHRRPAKWLAFDETARFRSHAQVHWTEPEEPAFADNVLQEDIIRLDPDGLVAALRGRRGGPPGAEHEPLLLHLAREFRALHRRLDTLERHAADLMFLVLSAQDLFLDRRRDFSERSQADIAKVAAAEPFGGRCPCCGRGRVLAEGNRVLPGAAFDHFFHRGLNKPEHGWLICRICHDELTHGGYLVRFLRLPEFRAFQAAVLEHRRREWTGPGGQAR